MRRGWYNDHYKHSLAARGIRTRFALHDQGYYMRLRRVGQIQPTAAIVTPADYKSIPGAEEAYKRLEIETKLGYGETVKQVVGDLTNMKRPEEGEDLAHFKSRVLGRIPRNYQTGEVGSESTALGVVLSNLAVQGTLPKETAEALNKTTKHETDLAKAKFIGGKFVIPGETPAPTQESNITMARLGRMNEVQKDRYKRSLGLNPDVPDIEVAKLLDESKQTPFNKFMQTGKINTEKSNIWSSGPELQPSVATPWYKRAASTVGSTASTVGSKVKSGWTQYVSHGPGYKPTFGGTPK
jgi:hypothetical protein